MNVIFKKDWPELKIVAGTRARLRARRETIDKLFLKNMIEELTPLEGHEMKTCYTEEEAREQFGEEYWLEPCAIGRGMQAKGA